MKKIIYATLLLGSAFVSQAQDFDTQPSVNFGTENENMNFRVGGRFMADASYYHSDFTPMKSGAAITDARIRTSLGYKKWYFYADFDFAKGKFKQRNIYLQYTEKHNENFHVIRAGYYNNVASMANNTSRGSIHFIARAASTIALAPTRELGFSYKFYNKHFFANQGIFAENNYNIQKAGYQGFTFGGRWVYRPINNEDRTLHIGANFRYGHLGTGEEEQNTLKTNLEVSSTMETYADDNRNFLNAQIPWARDTYTLGAEAIYRDKRFFIRGEYIYKYITKERNDLKLFQAQLGGMYSWTTLDSWQKANPLGANKFSGGYLEGGFIVFGKPYKYNDFEAVVSRLEGKGLQITGRYSYLNLNDVKSGEYYLLGRDQYYPKGYVEDYPVISTSVGGGKLHSATLGLNYSINNFVQIILEYTYSRLQKDKFPSDKNFHSIQSRVVLSF